MIHFSVAAESESVKSYAFRWPLRESIKLYVDAEAIFEAWVSKFIAEVCGFHVFVAMQCMTLKFNIKVYFPFLQCWDYSVFTSAYTRKRHVNKIIYRIKLYRFYKCSSNNQGYQYQFMYYDVGDWVKMCPEVTGVRGGTCQEEIGF